MGKVSFNAIYFSSGLRDLIKEKYDCNPQLVVVDRAIGFNVRGQEVGRVSDRDDGGINVLFYNPGDQRDLPVFG